MATPVDAFHDVSQGVSVVAACGEAAGARDFGLARLRA
jgi:hypothetical protein